jgi:hypothetical protein
MKTLLTRLFLSTFFSAIAFVANSQVLFERSYSEFKDARKFSETDDGGYIVAGTSDAIGTDDMALIKLDQDGNLEWSNLYGNGVDQDWGEAAVQTLDGGYILVGGSDDVSFIVKTDELGDVEWQGYYDFGNVKRATDVLALDDTSYIVTGGTVDGFSNSDAGIARIDKNGDVMWSWSIPSASWTCCSYKPQIYRVIALSDGNILAVGSRFSGSSGSGYAIKIDEDGSVIWERRVTAFNRIYSATELSDGNIILSGRGAGSTYGVLAKIDAGANLIWTKEYTESTTSSYYPALHGVAETEDEDLLISAHSYDGKVLIIRANVFGLIQESYQVSSMFDASSENEESLLILPTSDDAFLIARGGIVKKFNADLSSVCGLSPTTYSDADQVNAIWSTTLTKNTSYFEPFKTFLDGPTGASSTLICETVICNVVASFDVSTSEVCDGELITFSSTGDGSTFEWYDEGTLFGSTETVNYAPSGAGDHTIELIAIDGSCDDATEETVSVIALPNVTVSQSGSVLTADEAGLTYQWVDCDDSYSEIPGATAQSFTASSNGSYAVIVNDGTCSDTSDCYTVMDVGFDELNDELLVQLHPNPTDGILYLNVATTEGYTYQLINIVGETILSSDGVKNGNVQISLDHLPAGQYFLKVNVVDKVMTKKVVLAN